MKHNAQNGISCIYPMAFSSEDAARMLGVSTKTLANWRCSGKGPAYIHLSDSPRSSVLYLSEDLDAWLRSRRRCGGEN